MLGAVLVLLSLVYGSFEDTGFSQLRKFLYPRGLSAGYKSLYTT